jgi:hypothetical protein
MENEKPEGTEAAEQQPAAIEPPAEATGPKEPPAEDPRPDAPPAEDPRPEPPPAEDPRPEAPPAEEPDPSPPPAKDPEPAAEAAASEEAPPAEAAATDEAPPADPAPELPPEPAIIPEHEPPHIEALAPAHGPVRGGTRVEITGVHFVEGAVVRFGDTDAPTTFESDTLLVAIAPERPSFGFADVRVTNPDGKSEVRVHGFNYDVPPLPEFVKPDTLGLRGGLVRVFGEAFAEGITALSGGLPVPVVFKGEDCLEVTIPGGDPGPVDLTLTNPDGQSAVLSGKLRLSEGPVIEGVSPDYGPPAGGTRVTVTGKNFTRGCTITLFGTLAPQVTFDSDKKLFFTAPAHEPGAGSLRVTNLDGLTTVREPAFEYRSAPAPAVTQLSPDRAWVSGGSRLLVSGSDFVEGITATIGGKDAPVKWKNGGLLEVMVPAGADPGAVDLVVANPDGQTGQSVFTYEKVPTPPKLITVTPSRGPTHGNVTVVLTGDNFDEQTVVRVGEVRTTTKLLSRTEMEVLVPPHIGEGPVAIELVSGEGVAVRSEDVFYYNDRPPPKVTGVAPTQGPMSGNTRVSIEGEGFTQDCWVRIGRERPKAVTIKSDTAIEIVTPPCKVSGFVDIEVGTNQTGSGTAKNAFRFVALPPPQIDSVAPNRGSTNGGTEVSITGKHFNADVIVTINGKQLKYKLISPDLIETRTPPGQDGQMVDVSVKNPDGKEAVVRRAFAYDARYRQ